MRNSRSSIAKHFVIARKILAPREALPSAGSVMTDDEWEKRRDRVILAAFQTGRPVFADSDGEMRYADGDREPLEPHEGVTAQPVPGARVRISWWRRLWIRLGGRS